MSDLSTPSQSSASSRSSSISSSGVRTPPNLHQNTIDPSARWLVQKFGGTSVGKFATKIASDVVSDYLDQHKVAVVCSARSGTTKALGTTNLLLKAASQALDRSSSPLGPSGTVTPSISNPLFGRGSLPQSPVDTPLRERAGSGGSSPYGSFIGSNETPSFVETVDVLRAEHLSAARSTIQDQKLLANLEAEIERDCEHLKSFLFAARIIDEISPRSRDSIVGFGERLACKFMAAVLRDHGVDAEYVSLENIVPQLEDSSSGDDQTLDQDFYDRLAVAVGERVKQCAPRVPVVTVIKSLSGFFGPVPGSLLKQIGRGYTDLLSALLAVGLEASELQIWKEVDGIFTADPRKVPTARLISIISPDEAAELTYYGSEVVHPFTMEQVIRRKIPIRIKNVENPKGGGTVIHPDPEADAHHLLDEMGARVTSGLAEPLGTPTLHDLAVVEENGIGGSAYLEGYLNGTSRGSVHQHKKLPTAVTIKERIVVLNVNSNRKSVSHGFLAGIFGTLDRFGVVVDLISTSEVHVSMAIEEAGMDKKGLEKLVRELRRSGSVSVHRDMAILSLVGKQMRNMVGIAGRMFQTLAQGNVNIEMISQGASEINISCVIDGRDAVKALNLIHQSCLQIRPEGAKGRVGPWLF
ncbi:aspartate kinase [Punctularia strigosozonata HHB-11173 SS5]|uniref:aspartate kinase n=1 Tax=Punctularia strigosozonata (strain HHB-11173) TaxID=741275 RepID=UPI0004417C23|nr:aspartate kinase [Punctularia strigosozonata HHB-11173 SS5]EIN09072.1 aspartate kinase [Punctularia strigosozonata HHB-11173 SS5]